jgi:D-alanine-D-alanine ligase
LFASEIEFVTAAATDRLDVPGKPRRMVYNGIEGGIGTHAFGPGRKALIPALCDAFAIPCANSNAYACAIGRHKFHYSQILRANGLPVPPTWFYEIEHGWMLGYRPPPGVRVIVKSTYESWSVGVSVKSVFTVGQDLDERVHAISAEIGQSVCIQLFRKGQEVCVPILACPAMMALPPVGTLIARRPGDPEAVMTMEDNLAPGGVRHFRYEGADEATCRRAANLAGQCARVLGLSGLSRMDMRIDEGDIVVFDIGVSPGITEKGSSAASFAALGYDHRRFVQLVFAGNLAARGLI